METNHSRRRECAQQQPGGSVGSKAGAPEGVSSTLGHGAPKQKKKKEKKKEKKNTLGAATTYRYCTSSVQALVSQPLDFSTNTADIFKKRGGREGGGGGGGSQIS